MWGAGPVSAADLRTPNYAGFRTTAGAKKTASATFKIVAVTCTSATTGAAMEVNAVRGSSYVHAAVFIYYCNGGHISYYAQAVANGAGSSVQKTAAVGDTVTVSMTVSGTTVKSTVKDVTKNWTLSKSGALGTVGQLQVGTNWVQVGTTTIPVAHFAPETFTAVTLGGKPFGQSTSTRLIMGTSSVVKVQSSAITGANSFTNTWKHA
jgi:hypothetical protein